jgi:hypothetical protein
MTAESQENQGVSQPADPQSKVVSTPRVSLAQHTARDPSITSKESSIAQQGIVDALITAINKLKVQVFLFVIAYVLVLAIVFLADLGHSLVSEMKILLTVLPLLAMIIYVLTSLRSNDQLARREYGPQTTYSKMPRGSTMKDQEQYARLLACLSNLLDLQFEEIKQELLTIPQITALSGQDRIHFLGDVRRLGLLNNLESLLRQKYPDSFR